jgi:ribulose-phosphate 3-epimerase
MSLILSPSILNSDFLDLRANVEMLNKSKADWIHLDIMDGNFVPNISIGLPIVSAISSIASKPLDVHLMIVNPDRYIDDFIEAGAKILTVHYEACTHLNRTVEYIKSKGVKAGVAINPHTPVSVLEEVLPYADLILNMTVNPGFGGQKLVEGSFDKIKKLKELILKKNANTLIEIDGGVDFNNIRKFCEVGVDAIVAGSLIFKSEDPLRTIEDIKETKINCR